MSGRYLCLFFFADFKVSLTTVTSQVKIKNRNVLSNFNSSRVPSVFFQTSLTRKYTKTKSVTKSNFPSLRIHFLPSSQLCTHRKEIWRTLPNYLEFSQLPTPLSFMALRICCNMYAGTSETTTNDKSTDITTHTHNTQGQQPITVGYNSA
jgi:hypothetical protein